MSAGNDILTVKGLNAAYGEAKVLFDIDMTVPEGKVVACVGRNGAGKTTLLKSIVGFLKPTSGEVVAGPDSLVGRPAYEVAHMGIKYVPQDKKVFSDLTVRENLDLGSYATKDYDWSKVLEYFPKLNILMDRKAGHLSGGERQMLMIGRAILGVAPSASDRRADRGAGAEHRRPPSGRVHRPEPADDACHRGTEPAAGLRHRPQDLCHQRRADHGGNHRPGRDHARNLREIPMSSTKNDARDER